ncbi:MAG: hypothetical protein KAJ52_05865 [Sedimentisphaerales bacterium]|nr:hypothetical protein [Sedimentisphaerales bacterium]
MPIKLKVRKDKLILVPIRFARAVTGDPVKDTPEIDDRGFAMGTRQGTWGQSEARGAMVGITAGDTVRIKLLREDIEPDADLYLTSDKTNIVEVISPDASSPVPADGIFKIKGVKDVKNQAVKVEVRLGSATGPVIGELEPHIFNLRQIRLTFHFVDILGTTSNRSAGDPGKSLVERRQLAVRELVIAVDNIWRPCGIKFTYANNRIFEDKIELRDGKHRYYNRKAGAWRDLPTPLGSTGRFANAGKVTTDATWVVGDAWQEQYREFDTLLKINALPNTINIYCVHTSDDWNGLCYVAQPNSTPDHHGLAITDAASFYDLAHELGHYIGNDHSDQNAAGTDTDNKDMWQLRRLMYSDWPPDTPAHRNNVGYGSKQYGALVSVKNLPDAVEVKDNELATSRKHARRPYKT